MEKVEKTVLVQHAALEMFLLVDDVKKYTEFLPWCGGVDVIKQDEISTIATIHIQYHGLKQKFTTENFKTKPSTMTMALKDGPFKHLEGLWQFSALGDHACKINFSLQYEFSNMMLDKIIAPVFGHIANTFVDSFVARADAVFK